MMQWLVVLAVAFCAAGAFNANAAGLEITQTELAAPTPAIPFYHFKLQLALPHPSIILVRVSVDGQPALRFTDLYSVARFNRIEMDRPTIYDRPPSGYQLSQDMTLYKTPYVVGWLRWQPGQQYHLKVTVRMKSGEQDTEKDVIVSATKAVTAPGNVATFDPAWKHYQAVVASETAGIARTNAPVSVVVPFYAEDAHNIKQGIRVVAVDPKTHALTEVPSQIDDVRRFLATDDLEPVNRGEPKRDIQLFYPTVTARLTFLASVPARASRVFLVFYANPEAKAKVYATGLYAKGEVPSGMTIGNRLFTAEMLPRSGSLNRMVLHSMPNAPVYNAAETNGAIQWTPDIYAPPVPWTHASDWLNPFTKSSVGPVVVSTNSWGPMRHYPGVEASIKYWFYPDKPYVVFASTIQLDKTVNTVALRNGEMVFARKLFDRASWYDAVRDSVVTFDLDHLTTLAELRMPADAPWVSFYNSKTGIGFAGIQLGYANSGLEYSPRLMDPHMYVTVGPWVYWSRPLSASYLSANPQQMIPALRGNRFSEKWAYLMYQVDQRHGDKPYAPVLEWQRKLTHPLVLKLVQEVGARVPDQINELMTGKEVWDRGEVKK